MKTSSFFLRVWLVVLVGLVLVGPRRAAADDAGDSGMADAAADDASDGGMADGMVDACRADDSGACLPPSEAGVVACNGDLCDTTNGSTCGVAPRGVGRAPFDPSSLPAVLAVLLFAIARRVRRRSRSTIAATGAAAVLFAVTTPRAAHADPPPPVDVVLHDAPRPYRPLTIEWNPLALVTIGKLSANAVLVPIDHHALVLNLFYASTSTAPISIFDDSGQSTALPKQTFYGFGGELGYRYYSGKGGARGFFLGPSLVLASFTASAGNGTKTPYAEYGLAADAGYEALIADRVAVSLGGGLQYLATNKVLPDQQFPANIYTNSGLRPRLLFSIGWAF